MSYSASVLSSRISHLINMRVFCILALFVASVAARGSGPYLPSGWKPDGPAFYLPSEVENPKANPIQETLFQESEASGSESLREYGPPKVEIVTLGVSNQGLPDAVTEQTFAAIELKEVNAIELEQVEEKQLAVTENQVAIEDSEANLSEQSIVQEIVPATEVLETVEQTTETIVEENVQNVDIQSDVEVTTAVSDDARATIVETKQETVQLESTEVTDNQQTTVNEKQEQAVKLIEQENSNSDIVSTIKERLQIQEVQTVKEEIQKIESEVKRVETEIQNVETQVQNFETEVKTVEQLIQDVPEVLINTDTENKEAENLYQVPDVKVIQETFGSLEQAPEGFLEYGPPGFKEYGPPKEDLLRVISEEITSELQSIESNEARKRRYSPKFRVARKANRH